MQAVTKHVGLAVFSKEDAVCFLSRPRHFPWRRPTHAGKGGGTSLALARLRPRAAIPDANKCNGTTNESHLQSVFQLDVLVIIPCLVGRHLIEVEVEGEVGIPPPHTRAQISVTHVCSTAILTLASHYYFQPPTPLE